MEEDFTFGGQEHLLLAAVEETEAEQVLEFFDGDGDVRLRDFKLRRRGCSGGSFLLPSGSRQGIYLYIHKYNIYILAMP